MKKTVILMLIVLLLCSVLLFACNKNDDNCQVIAYESNILSYRGDTYEHSFTIKALWKESYFVQEVNQKPVHMRCTLSSNKEYSRQTETIGTWLVTQDNQTGYPASFAPNTYIYFTITYYDIQRPVFDAQLTIEFYNVEASMYSDAQTVTILDTYTIKLAPPSSNG